MSFRRFISSPFLSGLPVLLLTAALVFSASLLRAGKDESAPILPMTADRTQASAPTILPDPAPVPASPIKITMSSIPFETIHMDGFIIREVVVQNDSVKPATVTIQLRFTERIYTQTYSRRVTTTRQIPANSRQSIPLFVPTGAFSDRSYYRDNVYFTSADPRIYVNGREYRPLPSGFMDGQSSDRRFLPLPSTFSGQEDLAETLAIAIAGRLIYSSRRLIEKNHSFPIVPDEESFHPAISGSDTIQWPSIPQFYQSQEFIIRKTGDQFTPDAERAIYDAIMLGSTEVLLVTPGSPWPEWAPRPASPGMPSIVARGFGQSVVIDVSSIRFPDPMSSTAGQFRPPVQDDEDESFKSFRPEREPRDRNAGVRFSNANLPLLNELQNASVLVFNPASVFLALPHVEIPSIPFVLVIFALLAYIIVVGPVNYFYLIRKKKSVLLLLLTVPLITIVFVAVVIFFVSIVEGWSSSASAVGVTFLDQKENMAYTRAAVNLYAPVPVRSMTFDPADSVLFSNTKDVNVTLGRDQYITGANRARVPLAYSIARAEKHLEQVKVTRDASGVSIVNGLGVPLNKFMVKTDDGGIWTASGVVAPGESVRLEPFTGTLMTGEDINNALKFNLEHRYNNNSTISYPFNGLLLTASGLLLEMPTGLPTGKRMSLVPESLYGPDISQLARNDIFAVKKCLEKPGFLESVLPAGMYMAETDRPLFYSPGCKPVSFRARHIVFGAFAAQEAPHEN